MYVRVATDGKLREGKESRRYQLSLRGEAVIAPALSTTWPPPTNKVAAKASCTDLAFLGSWPRLPRVIVIAQSARGKL